MKRIISSSILVLIFCLAFAQTGLASNDLQSEVSAIRNELDALKQEVESLKQDVGNLRKQSPERFRVAVFPASLTGEGTQYQDVVVSALNQTFQKREAFVPVYSEYVLNKDFRAKPLPSDILKDQMWTRKSRWDLFEPAVQEVVEAGRRLDVDLVLMVSVVIPGSENDHMAAYLIDVKSGKLYAKNMHTQLKNTLTQILLLKSSELVTIIDKVFWEYKMEQGM